MNSPLPDVIFRSLAALAMAATVLLPSSPATAQTPIVVHVGGLPTDNSGNLYFALDLGYFKTAGLDVQIEPLGNGSAAAAALSSGAIDIAQSNVTATAAGHLRGFDFKIFAPAAISGGSSATNAVMVPKDSTAAVAADLNGKTVGILAVKSIQQVLAQAWVDRHGGDSKTVKFVEVPYPQMGAALAMHRVDAVLVLEPFLSGAKTSGRVIGNADDGIAPRFVGLAWGAMSAWLQTHADIATRFAGAVREAGIWANAHPNESADILAKYARLDPATAHAMARATYATTLDPALVQPVIDASAKYGALDRTFPATDILWKAP
jgi:NitT/TauT family transport system substrate-binding protein